MLGITPAAAAGVVEASHTRAWDRPEILLPDGFETKSGWLTTETSQASLSRLAEFVASSDGELVSIVDFAQERIAIVSDPASKTAGPLANEAVDTLGGAIDVVAYTGCTPFEILRFAEAALHKAIPLDQLSSADSFVLDVNYHAGRVRLRGSARVLALAAATGKSPHVDLVPGNAPQLDARCGDGSPHYGAAQYEQGSSSSCTGACTSAFAVRRNLDSRLGMSPTFRSSTPFNSCADPETPEGLGSVRGRRPKRKHVAYTVVVAADHRDRKPATTTT